MGKKFPILSEEKKKESYCQLLEETFYRFFFHNPFQSCKQNWRWEISHSTIYCLTQKSNACNVFLSWPHLIYSVHSLVGFFKICSGNQFFFPSTPLSFISVRNVVNLGGFALTGKIEFLPYVKVLNANPLIVNDAVFLGWEMKLVFCPNHFKRENHTVLGDSYVILSYSHHRVTVSRDL